MQSLIRSLDRLVSEVSLRSKNEPGPVWGATGNVRRRHANAHFCISLLPCSHFFSHHHRRRRRVLRPPVVLLLSLILSLLLVTVCQAKQTEAPYQYSVC